MFVIYLFTYLFLAHLLADFVFQPDTLIAWKHKNWKGVFVHSAIVFAASIILFWPLVVYLHVPGILVLVLNAMIHFWMDGHKIRLEHKNQQFVLWFFLDQILHITTLVLATFAFMNVIPGPETVLASGLFSFFSGFFPFALYLIAVVLGTYVYEIVKFQFERHHKKDVTVVFNYKDMFFRLIVLSLIFGLMLFFGGFHIAKTFLL